MSDLTEKGIINIIIYVIFNIYIQFYLTTKSTAFQGFELVHHILWYSIIIFQNLYIILILYDPEKYNSFMNRSIYNAFTKGGIDSLRDILLASEIEPLFEYFMLFGFVLIPWPILENVTFKRRFLLVFAKIGIFHFFSSIILMNWKTQKVNYNEK